MGRNLSGARKARGGQSLVEFALVIPLLLLMVLGVMEFGRAWAMSQVITDAARQGARVAAILSDGLCGDTDSVRRVVRRALTAGNIVATDQMITFPDGCNGGTATPVSVRVGVPYDFGVFQPVFTLASQSYSPKDNRPFDGTITLQSTAVMRKE
jgi:Flp pilus assembly protein TadG